MNFSSEKGLPVESTLFRQPTLSGIHKLFGLFSRSEAWKRWLLAACVDYTARAAHHRIQNKTKA